MGSNDVAYVLADDYSPSTGAPQVFGDFPGRYERGKPVALASLGLDEEVADRLIEQRGLPLQKTSAPRELDEDERELLALKRDALEERAQAAGIEDPSLYRTKPELAEAVRAAERERVPDSPPPAEGGSAVAEQALHEAEESQ